MTDTEGSAGGGEKGESWSYTMARTSIWWDIENCSVPRSNGGDLVVKNISSALTNAGYKGTVEFFVYGDIKQISDTVKRALALTGVTVNHVPPGGKDTSDKQIIVSMFNWALDNPPPANYLLISDDCDFSTALHKLSMRRYNILLAHSQKASHAHSQKASHAHSQKASHVLASAARTVWLWKSLLDGEPPLPHSDPSGSAHTRNEDDSFTRRTDVHCLKIWRKETVRRDFSNPIGISSRNMFQYFIELIQVAVFELNVNMLLSTEENIGNHIRYIMHIKDVDVSTALTYAVEHQVVIEQKFADNVVLYVGIEGRKWDRVEAEPLSKVKYPKSIWVLVKKFLSSPEGQAAMATTECRFHAATVLQNLSFCKDQLLGTMLQILNEMIDEKGWIIPSPDNWQPLSFCQIATRGG